MELVVDNTAPLPGGAIPPEGTKAWSDLRDRAAYLRLTGGFPSHLRAASYRALRALLAPCPGEQVTVAGVRTHYGMAMRPEAAERLRLDEHPMVARVVAMVRAGGRVLLAKQAGTLAARQPYGRILVRRADGSRVTVKADGSILDSWREAA